VWLWHIQFIWIAVIGPNRDVVVDDGVITVQSHIQLEGCKYCVEWHNTVSARSGPLSVHKLFTSCMRRCLVSRACDCVMSALSAALLIFSFQFSLLFFQISVARQHQHCGVLLVLIHNIVHRPLPKIWVGTFPVRSVDPRGKTLNWL